MPIGALASKFSFLIRQALDLSIVVRFSLRSSNFFKRLGRRIYICTTNDLQIKLVVKPAIIAFSGC